MGEWTVFLQLHFFYLSRHGCAQTKPNLKTSGTFLQSLEYRYCTSTSTLTPHLIPADPYLQVLFGDKENWCTVFQHTTCTPDPLHQAPGDWFIKAQNLADKADSQSWVALKKIDIYTWKYLLVGWHDCWIRSEALISLFGEWKYFLRH